MSKGQDLNGLGESQLLGPSSLPYSRVLVRDEDRGPIQPAHTFISLEIATHFRSKLTQGKRITPALALDYSGKAAQLFQVKL